MTREDHIPRPRAESIRAQERAPEAPEALALAAQGGDRSAFEALVARFEGPLLGYLFTRTGHREDALDLAQEAFLRAWTAMGRYDPRWRFSTWLFTIASRLATSRYRQGSTRQAASGDSSLVLLCAPDDPASELSQEEHKRSLWGKARDVLSGEQCAALWLRYVEDQSAEEIGQALGRRAVTVRVILFRARERLAGHLDTEQLLDSPNPPAPRAGAILARRVSGSNP